MPWPRDDAKLGRVRALMDAAGLDAIVARAPDNVLYLTNFWGMKNGALSACSSAKGEPTLLLVESSADDAARTAWTSDVRLVDGYLADDPRPPRGADARARRRARRRARDGRARALAGDAGVRPDGRRADDLHEGLVRRLSRRRRRDAGARRGAQAVKKAQEVERMRLANEIAAAAMENVRGVIRPGTTEAQIAAEWLGFVHGEGTGWAGKVELALGFSLVWAGPMDQDLYGDPRPARGSRASRRCSRGVITNGYWADHTKNLVVGELTDTYRELETGLRAVYDDAVAFCMPGASLAELDPWSTARASRGSAILGQPSHPICHGVGARAHEPPVSPTRRGSGEVAEGMVLAIEPGCYWEGGGGCRLGEVKILITADGPEKLSPFPDGIVQA